MRALANHDLFKQLSGNPSSIRILAAINANPMMQKNDLLSIYQKVKDEVDFLADDDKSMQSKSDTRDVMGNTISLRLSTEASIQLMKETMP